LIRRHPGVALPENIFLEERTQTLPVFIDDLKKNEPKPSQIEAKKSQFLTL
jgi:hypothetical protein